MDRPGAWHHVTARGNERKVIYRDDRDRLHFLDLLAQLPERFGLCVHAFVLMGNHYHLLVETSRVRLSTAMQWLNVSYSVWFNRRHRRIGHLLQGRFQSVLVEPETWALGLSRYIHLNPVRVARLGLDKTARNRQRQGLSEAPKAEMVRKRLRLLREFRWSSCRAYCGWAKPPSWLEMRTVAGGLAGEGPRAYRDYVESALREGLKERPWEALVAGTILGSREFAERWLRPERGPEGVIRARATAPTFAQVVAAVESVKGENWAAFGDRHGDWGRDLVLYVARKRCGLTLAQLSQEAEAGSVMSVSVAVKRFAERLRLQAGLRANLAATERALSVLNC